MEIAQIMVDSSISANWVMAGLMAILLVLMKRNGDKSDLREKKIDEILEKQQQQLTNHETMLALHRERIDTMGDFIAEHNKSLIDRILNTIRAATGPKEAE